MALTSAGLRLHSCGQQPDLALRASSLPVFLFYLRISCVYYATGPSRDMTLLMESREPPQLLHTLAAHKDN